MKTRKASIGGVSFLALDEPLDGAVSLHSEDDWLRTKTRKSVKYKKKPCTKCGGTSYNDSRAGLGDCCITKALPKKDRSGESGVKKTKPTKASSKKAGAGGKTRYSYPGEKGGKKNKTAQKKTQPARQEIQESPNPDPIRVPAEEAKPTEHRADPQELANQLQMPIETIKEIARRFRKKKEMGGRDGFISFMRVQLKKVVDKHKLDGDYFGLIYDALTGKKPQSAN